MKVPTACTFAVPIAPSIADSTAMAIFRTNCQLTPSPSGLFVIWVAMVI